MEKDPLETTVSDGLGKMIEASELIPEDKIKELADKCRLEAEKARSTRNTIKQKRN